MLDHEKVFIHDKTLNVFGGMMRVKKIKTQRVILRDNVLSTYTRLKLSGTTWVEYGIKDL